MVKMQRRRLTFSEGWPLFAKGRELQASSWARFLVLEVEGENICYCGLVPPKGFGFVHAQIYSEALREIFQWAMSAGKRTSSRVAAILRAQGIPRNQAIIGDTLPVPTTSDDLIEFWIPSHYVDKVQRLYQSVLKQYPTAVASLPFLRASACEESPKHRLWYDALTEVFAPDDAKKVQAVLRLNALIGAKEGRIPDAVRNDLARCTILRVDSQVDLLIAYARLTLLLELGEPDFLMPVLDFAAQAALLPKTSSLLKAASRADAYVRSTKINYPLLWESLGMPHGGSSSP